MEMNRDELLKRLMAGENAQDIADKFVSALNAAVEEQKRVEAETEAKRKEEEARAKREADINGTAEKAANAVNELIRTMYPELADSTEQITGHMMRDMVDSSYALVKEVEKVLPVFEKFNAKCSEKPACAVTKVNDKPACVGKRADVKTLKDLSEEDVNAIIESFCEGFNF